ncbi:MAG: nicotinate (nicotinamide) nucleotide adenylyltransferase [Endomicrobium sp.]|jgi:nicotinate-nucleotide adenylyltransferase|nr:nicotinate (nicotinamide) nucleotide adenylyltransferase [Endomicrobium sp.]
MSKIAIFGGSFDPVHKSHIQIAGLALKRFDLKELIFVVAYAPPHKQQQYAGIEDRISMLRLVTYNIHKARVSCYEAQKKGIVYSYQTLDHFKSLYSMDEIYIIIGSDSFLNLSTWKNIDYIVAHYRFIIAKRANIAINNDAEYLDRCIFIDKEIEDISSTKVREFIKLDRRKAASLLDKKVYNYIIQKRLYK